MANPRTWALLEAMQVSMGRIRIANGFLTDVGATVTLEPAQIPDTSDGLIALALEDLQPATDPGVGRLGRRAIVVAIAKVPITLEAGQIRAHELLADLEGCFDAARSDFPIGLEWPKYLTGKIIPPADGVLWIGAEVRFSSHVRLR